MPSALNTAPRQSQHRKVPLYCCFSPAHNHYLLSRNYNDKLHIQAALNYPSRINLPLHLLFPPHYSSLKIPSRNVF